MSSEDDSFLSAYLDGELDFDQHQQVDSALVANAELAERLRALSVVRELVVGLRREAGADITPMVMKRIRQRRHSRLRGSPFRPMSFTSRQAAAVAAIMTVAAGLVLAVTIAYRQPRDNPFVRRPRVAIDNVITDSGQHAPATAEHDSGPVVALQTSPDALRSPLARSAALDKAGPPDDSQAAAGDLEFSRKMLDGSHKRKFFLSKAGGSEQAEQRVVSAVEHTTQAGFLKITVSQGIVIDPRHPEEATVFALLVKSDDVDRLRDQLKVALPDLIEEKSADPAIVTQLVDIGRVQALAPTPLGEVSISREAMALRTRAEGAAQSLAADTQPSPALPTAEQFRSAPLPIPAHAGAHVEAEHGTDLVATEETAHAPDAATAAPSAPTTGTEVATVRNDSVRHAPTVAKSDKTMLIFVWICKPRAS